MTIERITSELEHFWENQIIFRARWLLAPAYFVLIVAIAVLAYKTVEELFDLVIHFHGLDESRATAQALVIVDLILVMNLMLMVLFVGYANFVSVIHPDKIEDWPKWMGYLDYSGLKIQLVGSIIAISGIKLLRTFVDMADGTNLETGRIWLMVVVHLTFVVSILVLAIVNRLLIKTTH